jgi:hypothetical protein
MANGNHARFNLIGKRTRPGTFPGIPLKRLKSGVIPPYPSCLNVVHGDHHYVLIRVAVKVFLQTTHYVSTSFCFIISKGYLAERSPVMKPVLISVLYLWTLQSSCQHWFLVHGSPHSQPILGLSP